MGKGDSKEGIASGAGYGGGVADEELLGDPCVREIGLGFAQPYQHLYWPGPRLCSGQGVEANGSPIDGEVVKRQNSIVSLRHAGMF
jgi:hypothetical protein